MKKNYKISIAIPTYNGFKGLQKHLKIFFNSKKKSLYEMVITDNCSTDKTQKLVKNYQRICKNIKYFRNIKNYGFNYNFLKSIDNCSGDFIFFLSDDTIPSANIYDELYNKIESSNNKIIFIPYKNAKIWKNKFFSKTKVSHVISRGSMAWGVILKRKKINYKYINKNQLYPQNRLYMNYFLKYDFENLKMNSYIYNYKIKENLISKFSDRMQRKSDYAQLDKIKSLEIYYKKNKIDFIEYFFGFYGIMNWVIQIKFNLNKSKNYRIEKIFFNKIYSYKKKFVIITLSLIMIKNIFNKKSNFILSTLLDLKK